MKSIDHLYLRHNIVRVFPMTPQEQKKLLTHISNEHNHNDMNEDETISWEQPRISLIEKQVT
jgi:hypothetical protein